MEDPDHQQQENGPAHLSPEVRATAASDISYLEQEFIRRGVKPICPFCENQKWHLISTGKLYETVIMTSRLQQWNTHTLACTQCGFVRMHIKNVIGDAPPEDAGA